MILDHDLIGSRQHFSNDRNAEELGRFRILKTKLDVIFTAGLDDFDGEFNTENRNAK